LITFAVCPNISIPHLHTTEYLTSPHIDTMFALRGLFLFALLLSLFSAIALSDTTNDEISRTDAEADYAAFQKLLADIDENAIHSALHRWSSKFRDGIFSKDRTAIEAVHSENPRLATKLVHLARRQSNSTATTSRKTSTTAKTTSEGGAKTTATKSASPSPTAAGTKPGDVVFTTNTEGNPIASTISGGVETLPTDETSFRRVSSTVLSTTTLPNGQRSTITAVTVVNSPVTDIPTPSGSAGVSPTGTGRSPSLQTGAASPSLGWKKEMVAMMGGAVVVAMALQ
jgi:hypothetical protein